MACRVLQFLATGARDTPGSCLPYDYDLEAATSFHVCNSRKGPLSDITSLHHDTTHRPETDRREEALKLDRNPDSPQDLTMRSPGFLCWNRGSSFLDQAYPARLSLSLTRCIALICWHYSVPTVNPSDKYPTSVRQCRVFLWEGYSWYMRPSASPEV